MDFRSDNMNLHDKLENSTKGLQEKHGNYILQIFKGNPIVLKVYKNQQIDESTIQKIPVYESSLTVDSRIEDKLEQRYKMILFAIKQRTWG